MENIISFTFGNYDFRNFKAESEDRGFFSNHINPLYSESGKKLADSVREFVRDASMNPSITTAFNFSNEPLMGESRRIESYGLSVGGLTFAAVTLTQYVLQNEEFVDAEKAVEELERLTAPFSKLDYSDDGVTPKLQFVAVLHNIRQLILRNRLDCQFLVRLNEAYAEVILQKKEAPDTNVSVKLITRDDAFVGHLANADAAVI